MAREDHCCTDDGKKATFVHYVYVRASNNKDGDRETGLQGRTGENGGIGG